MIEKMTFLNISGPKEDIDRMVDDYLGKYPIHLENALSELSEVRDLYTFTVSGEITDELMYICEKLMKKMIDKRFNSVKLMQHTGDHIV